MTKGVRVCISDTRDFNRGKVIQEKVSIESLNAEFIISMKLYYQCQHYYARSILVHQTEYNAIQTILQSAKSKQDNTLERYNIIQAQDSVSKRKCRPVKSYSPVRYNHAPGRSYNLPDGLVR
jgi:hypothetical protein